MQTERRVAANPQTKPTDLGCESTDKWLLPSTTQPESWYSFCRSTEGGRLSRARHCSKGVLSVPKAVVAVAVVINTTARGL